MSLGSSTLLPCVYNGPRPCTFLEKCVPVGGAVVFGCQVAVVSLATSGQGYQEAPDELETIGGGDNSDQEEQASGTEKSGSENGSDNDDGDDGGGDGGGAGYKQEEDSNTSVSEESVSYVVWEGADGVLEEWCVDVDQVIAPGTVLAKIKSSERLAHLIKADQYTQKLRSERMDWTVGLNARFQELTETLVRAIACGSRNVVHSDETLKACYDLERVARDFRDTARTYGKVIISEVHLPVEAKTLRPLKLGGTLGGSKYVIRDVLFKLGNGDLFKDYPDPLYIANKIQGHELKGLKSYFGLFFNKGTLGLVSFPLMALIDFKGHRITAMSELPISGHDTLILGSMNAGGECDVANKDPTFSKMVHQASEAMGLKPHYVTNNRTAGGEIEISCCVDLEGHKGKDGKKYLLDFSRTFPPVFKPVEDRQEYDKVWPFYHMFRAEFLLRYKIFSLLSPDAYSNFQSPLRPEAKAENHEEIRQATEFLRTQVVQNVCQALVKNVKSGAAEATNLSLSHVFHREGLNMRYVGLVYAKLAKDFYSEAMKNVLKELIAEALVRSLKNYIRGKWRAADGESNQLDATRDVLNAFFGKARNEQDWLAKNPFVLSSLVNAFSFTMQNAKFAVITFRTGSTIEKVGGSLVSIKFLVLKRLSEATGLEIDREVMQDLAMLGGSMRGRAFESETVFDGLDFSFTERVKQLDVVQRAFGLAQYLKGVQTMNENPIASEQFLLRGFFMVEKVLEASPLDPWLTALMGDLSCGLWMIMNAQCQKREMVASMNPKNVSPLETAAIAEQREVCTIFSKRAEKYYTEALSSNPIVAVLRNYAVFLLRCHRLSEAEQFLKMALDRCNDEGGSLNGVLLSEWELAGELMDLLKECNDLKQSGQQRRSSILGASGTIPSNVLPVDKKKKDSVVQKLGMSLKRRKEKAEEKEKLERSGERRSSMMASMNGESPPPGMPSAAGGAHAAFMSGTHESLSKSSSSGGAGGGGSGGGGSGGGPSSIGNIPNALRDSIIGQPSQRDGEPFDGEEKPEDIRLANERHKLLLARLRGRPME